jgi:CubicO group peptidase (beta-lactamase class C family)
MLVAMAVDEGLMNWTDKVSKYIPNFESVFRSFLDTSSPAASDVPVNFRV